MTNLGPKLLLLHVLLTSLCAFGMDDGRSLDVISKKAPAIQLKSLKPDDNDHDDIEISLGAARLSNIYSMAKELGGDEVMTDPIPLDHSAFTLGRVVACLEEMHQIQIDNHCVDYATLRQIVDKNIGFDWEHEVYIDFLKATKDLDIPALYKIAIDLVGDLILWPNPPVEEEAEYALAINTAIDELVREGYLPHNDLGALCRQYFGWLKDPLKVVAGTDVKSEYIRNITMDATLKVHLVTLDGRRSLQIFDTKTLNLIPNSDDKQGHIAEKKDGTTTNREAEYRNLIKGTVSQFKESGSFLYVFSYDLDDNYLTVIDTKNNTLVREEKLRTNALSFELSNAGDKIYLVDTQGVNVLDSTTWKPLSRIQRSPRTSFDQSLYGDQIASWGNYILIMGDNKRVIRIFDSTSALGNKLVAKTDIGFNHDEPYIIGDSLYLYNSEKPSLLKINFEPN